MKKICFLIMLLISINEVAAFTTSQAFEDVFITYETKSGETQTNAVNYIRSNSTFANLYKLYFGAVSTFDYEAYEEEFLKTSVEEYLNIIVYHADEINTDNDSKWYYAAQYLIYEYLYSDYTIYFSDSNGNKITFLEDEIQALRDLILARDYDLDEIEIYNYEKIYWVADAYSYGSNITLFSYEDYITVFFMNDTESSISLINYFNKDEKSVLYVNDDDFILFEGGGEFTETQNIKVVLSNTSTIENDNPATGNISPFVPILIGIPVIIFGALVYKKTKKIK